jgi:beta-lactamase class A
LLVMAGSWYAVHNKLLPLRKPAPLAVGAAALPTIASEATVSPAASAPSRSETRTRPISSTRSEVHCTGPGTAAAKTEVARLQHAIATGRVETESRTGVAVTDQVSGVSCGANDRSHFRSASIIKATTVATLLWQAASDGRNLTSTEQGWAERAITVSDNDAESALWRHVGGAAGVSEFLAAAGMTNTFPGASGAWGLTQVTAEDQARLLAALTRPGLLSASARSYELGLMRQVAPDQAWGISTAAEEGTDTVALKNGWLPYPTLWVVNSIGYITGPGHRYTLVVLTDGSNSMQAGIDGVQSIADKIGDVIG